MQRSVGLTKPGFNLSQNLIEAWLIGGSEPVFGTEVFVMRMRDDFRVVLHTEADTFCMN